MCFCLFLLAGQQSHVVCNQDLHNCEAGNTCLHRSTRQHRMRRQHSWTLMKSLWWQRSSTFTSRKLSFMTILCHFGRVIPNTSRQLGRIILNIHVALDHFHVTLDISCHFGQHHKRPCFLLVFVKVYQTLLNEVIGKHGIHTLALLFESIRVTFVNLEVVVDTFAFTLIDLILTGTFRIVMILNDKFIFVSSVKFVFHSCA